jgi:hypothetical protein
MKKSPVFESKLVARRIPVKRSSNPAACRILLSLSKIAANRVLNPERLRAERTPLISALIWSSSAVLLSALKSKKARKTAGTCCWCLASHNDVNTPSGNIGEPGDKGDNGECKSALFEGLRGRLTASSADGDCARGAAFLYGSAYVCDKVSHQARRSPKVRRRTYSPNRLYTILQRPIGTRKSIRIPRRATTIPGQELLTKVASPFPFAFWSLDSQSCSTSADDARIAIVAESRENQEGQIVLCVC